MQKIKPNDFIEIDFIAKVKATNEVFDLTNPEEAKKYKFYNSNQKYKPLVFCVGENQVIQGLDKQIVGKETGKKYIIDISPEESFGKKDAKLIKIINSNVFLKEKINPVVGLTVLIDNAYGIIRSVTAGRVIVDFNNPLSGKDLVYELKINKIIEDDKEKLKCFLDHSFPIKNLEINLNNKIAEVKVPVEIPKPIEDQLNKKLISLIPNIKKLIFIKPQKQKKKEDKSI